METRRRFTTLVAVLALATALAAVLIWFIWSQLTDVLEGRLAWARDGLAVVLLVLLIGMVRWLGQWLLRLDPPS